MSTGRLGDPELIEEFSAYFPGPMDPLGPALEQARLVVAFLRELETGGLSHEEALWLTARIFRV